MPEMSAAQQFIDRRLSDALDRIWTEEQPPWPPACSSGGAWARRWIGVTCGISRWPRCSAHAGTGLIRFARIAGAGDLAGSCNFIDYAEVPPGASIGRHRHGDDEEELYLVLDGEGQMWRNGETFDVRGGDLVRNPPGGEHGLRNTGDAPLRLFVFELRVAR